MNDTENAERLLRLLTTALKEEKWLSVYALLLNVYAETEESKTTYGESGLFEFLLNLLHNKVVPETIHPAIIKCLWPLCIVHEENKKRGGAFLPYLISALKKQDLEDDGLYSYTMCTWTLCYGTPPFLLSSFPLRRPSSSSLYSLLLFLLLPSFLRTPLTRFRNT
jgi:hypothetical protein